MTKRILNFICRIIPTRFFRRVSFYFSPALFLYLLFLLLLSCSFLLNLVRPPSSLQKKKMCFASGWPMCPMHLYISQ